MKQKLKQYMAVFLAAAMVVTAFPAVAAKADTGDETGQSTVTIDCSKLVRSGESSVKTGTNDSEAYLVGTGASSTTGTEHAAARVEGETAKGEVTMGSTRIAAVAFPLSESVSPGNPQQIQPDLISHAELEITVFDGNDTLKNGKETKAAAFQVAAEKYDDLADDFTKNATGSTFPAKNGYAKEQTVYGSEWIKYNNKTMDQKVTFDVTDWVKAAFNANDAYAIFRLQTVIGGYFVYGKDAGANAPKLSITTLTEEQAVAQTLAELTLPKYVRSNFALPQTGVCGTKITWSCREADRAYLTIADGKATVTNPDQEDYAAELTATAVRGDASDTKTVSVIIINANDKDILASFDFDMEAVNGAFSSAIGNAAATIKGETVELRDRDTENGKAAYLSGKGFLTVTLDGKNPLIGLDEATISFDTKQERTATNWLLYAAPNEQAPTDGKERYFGALISGGKITVERYNNTNGRPTNPSSAIGNDWVHIDIVISNGATTLYANGFKKDSKESSYALTGILGEGGIFQIGKANWKGGEYSECWIDNFVIYSKALEEAEITTDEVIARIVKADADALKLPETVKADFDLPAKGVNGSDITWSVEKNSYIQIEGNTAKVTRSEASDENVKLTAVITRKNLSDQDIKETRTFTVTVEQLLGVTDAAAKQLTIPNLTNIRGNITLPAEIITEDYPDTAVEVTWKSDKPEIISATAANQTPAGVVNRQAKDTDVTLTATLTADGKTAKKELKATVKAAHQMEQTTDYLFAFFVNNGGAAEQQIFLASSHDGNNWMDLNKKEAVLSVADSVRNQEDLDKNQNQAGVRDPYILRSPEGDRFWIIATDLCIGTNNIAEGTVDWIVAQYSGSHCLRIWESDDLVHWSEPWLADVAPADTTCAWAPEAVYDDTTGEYIVFFAAMTTMENDKKVQKVYYTKTRDFRTFSEPVKMVDNGSDHIIDTTIIKADDGNYYRGSATGGSIYLEKCKDGADWKGLDSWEEQGSIKTITSFTAGLEGPELFRYNEDDWKEVDGEKVATYGLLADNYGGVGYVPFYTTDIANAKWVKTDDNEFNFDTLHKRHGGILTLTAEEYSRVMEAYGPAEITVKKAPNRLDYNSKKQTFIPDQLVLTVKYADGRTEDVTYAAGTKNARQFTFQTAGNTVEYGEQDVTVTYGEKSVVFRTTIQKDPWDQEPDDKILAAFTFDQEESFENGTKGFTSENAMAVGNFALQDSYNTSQGKALYLDGSNTNFLTVTDKEGNSLLTGANELTISYEFKPDRTETNWIFYAAPNSTAPVNQKEHYLGALANSGTTTIERYNNTNGRPTNPSLQTGSDWHRVDIVIEEDKTTVYLNGIKRQSLASDYEMCDILGNNSILQIGKANWGSGEYLKGWIDNFRIKRGASTAEEVAELASDFADMLPMFSNVTVGTAPDRETALTYRGTDDHTAIWAEVNEETKEITSYVRNGSDLSEIPVTFDLKVGAELKVNGNTVANGSTLDLSEDIQITVSKGNDAETWKLKQPIICNNPVLPGQYADPDIDYFDGKFWIYPTTDGYPNWSGDVFHAFSSPDLVNWTDEGIIMQLGNDNPGKNENGVQIAPSTWAKGSAWAPTIEKKDDKYYFYYCGKDSDGVSSIGVAVADHPAGPYTDKKGPLVTKEMCDQVGVDMGQAIDPSIFTDTNGKSYLLFGNGSAAIAELNDDMISIKEGTLKQIKGLTDFRESVIVTKVNGKYHWTWSCDDANSPNYHVNYGVSDTLVGSDGAANVTLKKKNLLSKDESKGILGSAHQSVVHVQDADGQDRYFMAYHRFYTPTGIFTSADGLGKHRETCIDEIIFDANGDMTIAPTLEGVGPVNMTEEQITEVTSVELDKDTLTMQVGDTETLVATVVPSDAVDAELTWTSDKPEVAEVKNGTVTAKGEGTATITVSSKNNKTASCVVTVTKKTTGGGDEDETNKEVESVSLNKTQLDLKIGQTETLQATVLPADAVNAELTWTSDKPEVAEVKNGVVTAKAEGTAVICAQTSNGKKAECTVTVTKADSGTVVEKPEVKVSSVKLNKSKLTLGVKETFTLTAAITPKDATDKELSFTSSKPKVASVSNKGVVKAKKIGKTTITVTAGGKQAKCVITVKAAPKKISLNAKSKTLKKGKTFQIKVKLPAKTASNKITYKTSNKKVATVSASGKVKAVKKGNATITVQTFNKKKAKLKIKVN